MEYYKNKLLLGNVFLPIAGYDIKSSVIKMIYLDIKSLIFGSMGAPMTSCEHEPDIEYNHF